MKGLEESGRIETGDIPEDTQNSDSKPTSTITEIENHLNK